LGRPANSERRPRDFNEGDIPSAHPDHPTLMAMAAPVVELHVLPHASTGGWTLETAWFATLGEAEQAARRHAGEAHIFLHDRYHRVRRLYA
jgi:hypothetical protein